MITLTELKVIAARELPDGPAARALDAYADWDLAEREAAEIEGDVAILRDQLCRLEQDLQIAHRARLEAGRTYRALRDRVRCG